MRRLGLVTVSGLLIAACTGAASEPEPTLPGGTITPPSAVRTSGALVQFDACEDFLDYVIDHALDLVGPYGLDGRGGPWFGFDQAMEGPTALDSFVARAEGGNDAEFSSTNVQVDGVDEPDLVKTDGERIVVIADGRLIVVDIAGDEPEEVGRISLRDQPVQSLFMAGDRVLLFGSVWAHRPLPLIESDRAIAPLPAAPTTQIVEVDISDSPEIVRTLTVDGAYISGRMADESVRLVSTSGPVGFEWQYPEGSGLRAEREATEANREIVRNSTPENWIPYFVITDESGEVLDEGALFECDRAAHPDEFSGLDMLSVVTIEIERGLEMSDATGVLARGDTVYASAESLYVATRSWESWVWLETGGDADRPEGPKTQIHKFDISDPSQAEYLASGSVEGYLLNQFALDEHEGMLRVASTTTPQAWGSDDSESRITVLREIGDDLVRVGLVDGLGVTEQIYSVRFMGDIGYVVTFRQTDPLYTIDLSDPRNPVMVGELKIPGYSAYLHPIGDGLLLGVGQDATDEGNVLGTQVSVFDVSDVRKPERLDTYTLSKGSNSEVEYDHHAFLFWDGLAMIPVQQYEWDEKGESGFVGAVGLRVERDGDLREVDTVVHPGGEEWDWRARIMRSVVVGDAVYTVSPKGILKSALSDLDELSWLGF